MILLPTKLQAVTFHEFRIQMLRSDFLVLKKQSHTNRLVNFPMLRKQLTFMILLFRRVQPLDLNKWVLQHFRVFLFNEEAMLT